MQKDFGEFCVFTNLDNQNLLYYLIIWTKIFGDGHPLLWVHHDAPVAVVAHVANKTGLL